MFVLVCLRPRVGRGICCGCERRASCSCSFSPSAGGCSCDVLVGVVLLGVCGFITKGVKGRGDLVKSFLSLNPLDSTKKLFYNNTLIWYIFNLHKMRRFLRNILELSHPGRAW